jgi:hypothetical protein
LPCTALPSGIPPTQITSSAIAPPGKRSLMRHYLHATRERDKKIAKGTGKTFTKVRKGSGTRAQEEGVKLFGNSAELVERATGIEPA